MYNSLCIALTLFMLVSLLLPLHLLYHYIVYDVTLINLIFILSDIPCNFDELTFELNYSYRYDNTNQREWIHINTNTYVYISYNSKANASEN